MWIDRLLSSPTARAIELTSLFCEQRHRVLAENLANLETPDYHSRSLDPKAFQASLRAALERGRGAADERLELRGNAQFATGADGRIRVRPTVEPAPNILFHDGTNARLERLVTDINENAMLYELTTDLLRNRHRLMLSAIRGRIS